MGQELVIFPICGGARRMGWHDRGEMGEKWSKVSQHCDMDPRTPQISHIEEFYQQQHIEFVYGIGETYFQPQYCNKRLSEFQSIRLRNPKRPWNPRPVLSLWTYLSHRNQMRRISLKILVKQSLNYALLLGLHKFQKDNLSKTLKFDEGLNHCLFKDHKRKKFIHQRVAG